MGRESHESGRFWEELTSCLSDGNEEEITTVRNVSECLGKEWTRGQRQRKRSQPSLSFLIYQWTMPTQIPSWPSSPSTAPSFTFHTRASLGAGPHAAVPSAWNILLLVS